MFYKFCLFCLAGSIIWGSNLLAQESSQPRFISNTIFYQKSSYSGQVYYGPSRPKEMWRYTIDEKRVQKNISIRENWESSKNQHDLSKFLTILKESAYSDNSKSKNLTPVILLNRMESVDEKYNKDFETDPKISGINCSLCVATWAPQWKKGTEDVPMSEVRKYYADLPETEKYLFLQYENQMASEIVPYASLREALLKSNKTNEALDNFKKENDSAPVYVAFVDKDTLSFNHVFDKYTEEIVKNPELFCLTGGYKLGFSEEDSKLTASQKKGIELANELDMGIRSAMESVIPFSTYFTDLNTVIKLPLNSKTGFKLSINAEEQKSEIQGLLNSIIKHEFGKCAKDFAKKSKFVNDCQIVTTTPARFFKNKCGNKIKFSNLIDFTVHDLQKICNICQSHRNIARIWSNHLYNRIKDLITPKTVKLMKKYTLFNGTDKMNFLKSVLPTLYNYYSPIEILKQTPKASLEDYTSTLSKKTHLNITFGKKGSDYKELGDAMRESIKTIEQLKEHIAKFFPDNTEIVNLIEVAIKKCAEFEREFIQRLVQQKANEKQSARTEDSTHA